MSLPKSAGETANSVPPISDRGRNAGMHQHDQGLAGEPRDRRDIAHEVEGELVVERGVDRVGGAEPPP
jgi:hypothetical protein